MKLALLISAVAATAQACATPDSTQVAISSLKTYPDFQGVSPQGYFNLEFVSPGTVKITGSITANADPSCAGGIGSAANSCGVHIHTGYTCDVADEVGGHYYNSALDADPWATAGYTDPTDISLDVVFGEDYTNSGGRAFVVHDYTGARVACALITQWGALEIGPLVVNKFSYPEYSGAVPIEGTASMAMMDNNMVSIKWNLIGTEDTCTGYDASDPANACGIHIHSGTGCDMTSQPGGHFWLPTDSTDPWVEVVYTSVNGYSSGEVQVSNGVFSPSNLGRVLVVHDKTGARATCTKIALPEESACCSPGPVSDAELFCPATGDCVCGFDPYCCNTYWDDQCAGEAAEYCGLQCKAV